MTDDLENQADPNPNCSDDRVYNNANRQLAVKERIWWLMRAFMSYSTRFFPISVLSDYGFLSCCPSGNAFGIDYESNLPYIRRIELQLTHYLGYIPPL